MSYINTSDIKSKVLSKFDLNGYVDRANDHIAYIASSLGLKESEIGNPIHHLLKEYGIAYVGYIATLDMIGTNNIDMGGEDKYSVLNSVWEKEMDKLRPYLTYEVLTNKVNSSNSSARTSILFRN